MNDRPKVSLEGYGRELANLIVNTCVTDGDGRKLALAEGATRALGLLREVADRGLKCLLAGNGGSAGVVAHVQNDLCKADGIRAMVFTEQPLLTALANDRGYETVYEFPIRLWASSGDLLIAVSSSGRSENILRAVRAARQKGCSVISLSGFAEDNPLRSLGDLNFHTPSSSYGHVETSHAAILHFLTDQLRSPAD